MEEGFEGEPVDISGREEARERGYKKDEKNF